MKSRQRASARRYRIVFGKAQAGVFALILLALMTASFGFGYLWGGRGASNEMPDAEVVAKPEAARKNKGKEADRESVAALIKKFETETEAAKKTADAIKPKFYQDLVKENQENEQPIEPIKLPVVKVKIPPKPTPPPAAAVEEPPGPEKPLDEKAEVKKENTNEAGNETPKRAETNPRTSKPWTKASGYTIQVVSVKKFDEALQVVRKLRDAGFQPFIQNADLGARGKWYRVRVGHYRDRAEAQKALSEMQAKIRLQSARIMAM